MAQTVEEWTGLAGMAQSVAHQEEADSLEFDISDGRPFVASTLRAVSLSLTWSTDVLALRRVQRAPRVGPS
jgi:hypothetical protein